MKWVMRVFSTGTIEHTVTVEAEDEHAARDFVGNISNVDQWLSMEGPDFEIDEWAVDIQVEEAPEGGKYDRRASDSNTEGSYEGEEEEAP